MPLLFLSQSSSSQFSFADSVRLPPTTISLSSSFRIHPDFISRAIIFPSRGRLLLDFLRAIIFSPSPYPRSRRRASSRAATRARSHRYPLTCRRFFTRGAFHLASPRALLTVRRTLESHKALRRIFHAAISASRGERRHSSRRPKEKWGALVWTRSDEISLAFRQTSWCRATTEKEAVAIGLIGRGKRVKRRETAIQRKKRAEWSYPVAVTSSFAFIREDECLRATSSADVSCFICIVVTCKGRA